MIGMLVFVVIREKRGQLAGIGNEEREQTKCLISNERDQTTNIEGPFFEYLVQKSRRSCC
jgi:hypothetical protein